VQEESNTYGSDQDVLCVWNMTLPVGKLDSTIYQKQALSGSMRHTSTGVLLGRQDSSWLLAQIHHLPKGDLLEAHENLQECLGIIDLVSSWHCFLPCLSHLNSSK